MNATTYRKAIASVSPPAAITRLRGTNWRVSGAFLAWFFGLWALSWVAIAISGVQHDWFGDPKALRFTNETQPLWLYTWARWDGQWYLSIASQGYNAVPYYDTAFFPLYPLLIAVVHGLTTLPWAGAGLIVSYACLALALVYLYKLARLDLGRDGAVRACLALLLYPTAFFLLSVYTESLLLLLTCAALYYARTGRWWLVAILAYAAGLAKIAGLVLAVALLFEALLGDANAPAAMRNGEWRSLLRPRALLSRLSLPKVAALLGVPLGILTYMAYLYWLMGDPLAFVKAQSAEFWRGDAAFWETQWNLATYYFSSGFVSYDLPKLGDLAALALLVVMLFYLARNVRLSYAAFAGAFLVVVILSRDVFSLNRFLLTMPPIFIGLASAAPRTPRTWAALIAVFVPLQIFFALRFFLWQWVD